jgi:hypothetical protein
MTISPHDRIRVWVALWEDTSPEAVNDLQDRVDHPGLEAAVAILAGLGADAVVARKEVGHSAIWLARLDADLGGMKLTVPLLRRTIGRQLSAVNALIEFYEGRSDGGPTAARILAKALLRQAQHDGTGAEVGSVSTLLPGLYTQRRACDMVLQSLPKHRPHHSLQAAFVANEALRFERLTGVAPVKTVDPDSGQLVGPFHDYFRALEGSVSLGLVFTTREIHNGLDLARGLRDE